MPVRHVNRREFLRLSAFATVGTLAAACAPTPSADAPPAVADSPTPAPASNTQSAATSGKYSEAPILAERVTAGELPPVDERLPQSPLVVEPIEEIGQYGGTWRAGLLGAADSVWLMRTAGYDFLLRWNLDWTVQVPSLAESWEVNEDGTTYTLHLRQGIKWSDGEPFTADDILFWYEDIAMNPELTPTVSPEWTSGGEAVKVEKVDEYTLVFAFSQPNGLFLINLASPSAQLLNTPKHYLQQFHPNYVEAAELDAKVEEAGFQTWIELFNAKGFVTSTRTIWQNPDLPSLNAWIIKTPLGDAPQVTLERNPYYWKVDPNGQQLPYIDDVFMKMYETVDALLLDAVAGNIDFQGRHIGGIENLPILTQGAEAGGYRLTRSNSSTGNVVDISFNLTHKDPAKREILQNDDFRKAMSIAINRQEIIDTVFRGQGEARQLGPLPGTPAYNEELAKGWTEFDPETANTMLDAILPDKDSDGFRLGADGNRFTLVHEAVADFTSTIDSLELVMGYWADVGVEVILKPEDRSLLYDRKAANDHDLMTGTGYDGVFVSDLTDPRFYLPFSTESIHMEGWVEWFQTNGASGEEPLEDVKRCIDLYQQIVVSTDSDEQVALMQEILAINAEHLYALGITAGAPFSVIVVKNTMHNVPEEMWNGWLWPDPGPVNTSQFFFKTA